MSIYDESVEKQDAYLEQHGWERSPLGDAYRTDPLERSTSHPRDDAVLIQMDRDGLPNPLTED